MNDHETGQSPDRRETILSLVELLLKNHGERGSQQTPSFEDDKDVPSVDEHIQAAGAAAFHALERRINNLDKELRNFANAARQLGSSVAILSSAYRLRERLAGLLFLYHENAADLFPRKIYRVVKEFGPQVPSGPGRRRTWRIPRSRHKAQLHVPRPTVTANLDLEAFPEAFEQLAQGVVTFLACLNEFPEFTDEAVNSSVVSFEGDLNYWASCLKEYSGQFRYPAVQRYIHDLSTEMGEHMEELTSSLGMFIEVGVPMIRFAQQHGADNLLNLSTVATFFSAVTATTLQFSYELTEDNVSHAVNSLWFMSMVFSIAAAVNSLLGLTWKQAMYRSPGHRVPWWVLIWIKRSPLVFLVLSVACFSVGLCCFAYASGQAKITSTLTTVLTAFTSFGLAAVSAWFASERWAFARHRGQKWLQDVLDESFAKMWMLPGFLFLTNSWRALGRYIRGIYSAMLWTFKGAFGCFTFNRRKDQPPPDVESAATADADNERKSASTEIIAVSTSGPVLPTSVPERVSSLGLNSAVTVASPPAPPPQGPSVGKQLWKNAMRNVKLRGATALAGAGSDSEPEPAPVPDASSNPERPGGEAGTLRKRTMSSGHVSLGTAGGSFLPGESKRQRPKSPRSIPIKHTQSRASALMPRMTELSVAQELAAHSALVRHMEFSHDGRYLATSSWDKTALVLKVGTGAQPLEAHQTLVHTQGFVYQVAWNPKGKYLLTRMVRAIKLWNAEDGVCQKTIDRPTTIENISWFPDGQHIASIEESSVIKLDMSGCVVERYDFPSIKILDAAIAPSTSSLADRLILIGPLLRSPTGLQPSKSRVEKRIIVYNMRTKTIENTTPVLNDVKSIALSAARTGVNALLSFEHRIGTSAAPPQLWKIEFVKSQVRPVSTTDPPEANPPRLTLRHTYMPKTPGVDFIGPSYFGGASDDLVLCASKGGDIHIWDLESAALLHTVRAGGWYNGRGQEAQLAYGGDLTCLAWNRAAREPFMFVVGTHVGDVQVWTRGERGGKGKEVTAEGKKVLRDFGLDWVMDSPRSFGRELDSESESE